MSHGVFINEGPEDWQILQQVNGCADIVLAGIWKSCGKCNMARVFARVVKEESGEPVLQWFECMAAGEGRWTGVARNIPAGGLYRIETCLNQEDEPIQWSKRGDMIHHVGVGDIFVIAGQSNSAGYGKSPVYDPPEIGIHLYRNNGEWDLASHPMNESTGSIHPVNTETSNPGHSPYLSFAKNIKKALGYPIGLIQSSLGGSSLNSWNPSEDGRLYKSMLESIKINGGRIKGVLWYQGCSDTSPEWSENYLERFLYMVNALRKELNDKEIPFLTVQLNRAVSASTHVMDSGWGKVREAQRMAARTISNVFVIPSLDCQLSDRIHNSSSANMLLGERLARMAISEIYGIAGICKAPDINRIISLDEKTLCLYFDNIYLQLDAMELPAEDLPFQIEDREGTIAVTGYSIKDKNKLLLYLKRELKGKTCVHCAYGQNPEAVLPIDLGSYLPVLAFMGVEVEEK